MEKNNKVYNKLVADKVNKMTGYSSDTEWKQCFASNTTYADCPVNSVDGNDEYEMSVIVHNPSSADMSQA